MTSTPEAELQKRPRILVIDDEPDICDTVETILSMAGYEVCTADSGANAIERAQQEAFELAITDLRMPGMSGVEAVAALRRIDPGMPVIVVSGYTSDEAALRCRKEGAVRILDKPLQIDDLLQVVDAVLHEGRGTHHS